MMKQLDMKLTIEQLKNYLGTGLKFYFEIDATLSNILYGISSINILLEGENGDFIRGDFSYLKPICYKISDLNKLIPELNFVPSSELNKLLNNGEYSQFNRVLIEDAALSIDFGDHNAGYYPMETFEVFQKLFQWHFWPFGDEYFEAGLVIDKLKTNDK